MPFRTLSYQTVQINRTPQALFYSYAFGKHLADVFIQRLSSFFWSVHHSLDLCLSASFKIHVYQILISFSTALQVFGPDRVTVWAALLFTQAYFWIYQQRKIFLTRFLILLAHICYKDWTLLLADITLLRLGQSSRPDSHHSWLESLR